MKITRECDYAIRIILLLSSLKCGSILDAGSISDTQCIPKQFTVKILRKLIECGYIKSFKGVNGGYCMNVLPNEISLKDIITAIDGEIGINDCLLSPKKCNRVADTNCCPVHRQLSALNDSITEQLSLITIDKLLIDCQNH